MITVHNIKIKAYHRKTLNTSNGVVMSKVLSLCALKIELWNQDVTDVKRITKKGQYKSTLIYWLSKGQKSQVKLKYSTK